MKDPLPSQAALFCGGLTQPSRESRSHYCGCPPLGENTNITKQQSSCTETLQETTRCQDEEAVEAKPAVNLPKVKDTSGCREGWGVRVKVGGLGLGSGRWGLIKFDLSC